MLRIIKAVAQSLFTTPDSAVPRNVGHSIWHLLQKPLRSAAAPNRKRKRQRNRQDSEFVSFRTPAVKYSAALVERRLYKYIRLI